MESLRQSTVICAVWHKDPAREQLLRGHMDNLDRQTAPVDRVYVFDGDDQPPKWLTGQVVVVRGGLTIYEAWNVALSLVRTPYVLNLNLDDRLAPEAVAVLEAAMETGADLVGGDWWLCFSQRETDRVESVSSIEGVAPSPVWPPDASSTTPCRLGTSDVQGTVGPACMWRLSLHLWVPRYPYRFIDGRVVRIIGDSIWWSLLDRLGKKKVRLPLIIGNYHSHPGDQAEFRGGGPAEEHEHAKRSQISLL